METREKLKSRPSFAPERRELAEELWEFRRKENISKTDHIECLSDGKILLFEYGKRDPLSGNARITDISEKIHVR